MVDGGLAGCDRRCCSRNSGSGRAAVWVSGRYQLAIESSLDARVAAGSEMAREEPRRARSAVHGAHHLMLCFRAILLRCGGAVNLAVGVWSLWRGSSFSMIVGGVCMFRKLAFLHGLRFLWHAGGRALSLVSCAVCACRERVSVEYGPNRSGHADMATVLSASPRLVMDTVATEAGVCRNIETLMYVLSDRHAVSPRARHMRFDLNIQTVGRHQFLWLPYPWPDVARRSEQ